MSRCIVEDDSKVMHISGEYIALLANENGAEMYSTADVVTTGVAIKILTDQFNGMINALPCSDQRELLELLGIRREKIEKH